MSPRHRAEMLRDEMVMHDRIVALVRDNPRTIPALAEALGHPSPEVVCWVMAMRRYGVLEEDGPADGDGYFSYTLTEKARGEGGAP
ncbi:MAG: MarR family transcriptional regulator [Acidimicrobiia bacterium]|nr:MarR family transcriptional regulator [Acidimicrobiia bacterium]